MKFDYEGHRATDNDNAAPFEWLRLPGTTAAEMTRSARTPQGVMNRIIWDIAKAAGTGVTLDEVLGTSRYRNIVDVRHRAMVEVYETFPWMSYPQMGRLFRRDHSTVMSALQKMGALKKRDSRGGGANSINARIYGHHIDFLFVRIGAALSVPAKTEGETHENP